MSYTETLRQLEKVYDVVDDYAERMGSVVSKHAHWLLDKHCIVSIQLQHPPPPPGMSSVVCFILWSLEATRWTLFWSGSRYIIILLIKVFGCSVQCRAMLVRVRV